MQGHCADEHASLVLEIEENDFLGVVFVVLLSYTLTNSLRIAPSKLFFLPVPFHGRTNCPSQNAYKHLVIIIDFPKPYISSDHHFQYHTLATKRYCKK